MTAQNLLVELFVEELPPKALKKLGDAFAGRLVEELVSTRFVEPEDADMARSFASPRRLAVWVPNVHQSTADSQEKRKLMPRKVAYGPDGQPSKALMKKLESLGYGNGVIPHEDILIERDGGDESVYLNQVVPGRQLQPSLQSALDAAIKHLPIPKVMSYQLETDCELPGWTSVNFVRPAHRLVALHGSTVVGVRALGLSASNMTEGHRFECEPKAFAIREADSYQQQMREQGAVIASFAERKAEIVRQLAAAATKVGGGCKPIEDDALLDEVTALVERPNALICEFEPQFLGVPQECLILTMKANQKYFPLLDAAGKLTNQFLVVSNISPADASAVTGGNERVVRPRLADAKFFFDQDRKKTLASRVEGLGKVVYHNKLGTQGERMERVRAIARWVAERIGADVNLADRAALLAKADLLTDMVGEFPELQGVMGGYYARHDGENELVAQAIADQYVLNRSDTADADNLVSASLVLADRCETLVGIWGIGLKPTGEKDPFALRRHALTVLKTIDLLSAAEAIAGLPMQFSLGDLLEEARSTFKDELLSSTVASEVKEFTYERYSNQLIGLYGVSTVDAVLSLEPPIGQQTIERIKAVLAFAALPEAPALAAANKRIGNILKKAEGDNAASVNEALLVEPAEKDLFAAMQATVPAANAQFDAGDYAASLQSLAALRAPVDAFFDGVMVNADDPALKANRLGLLKQLHDAMNRVADLSRLAT